MRRGDGIKRGSGKRRALAAAGLCAALILCFVAGGTPRSGPASAVTPPTVTGGGTGQPDLAGRDNSVSDEKNDYLKKEIGASPVENPRAGGHDTPDNSGVTNDSDVAGNSDKAGNLGGINNFGAANGFGEIGGPGGAGEVASSCPDRLTVSKGRVVIPELDIDLPLCRGTTADDSDELQRSVDRGFAARIYRPDIGMDIIGAHNTGPFGSLGKARPGITVAYVDGSRYLCSAVFPGHNTGADLTDLAGNTVSRSGKLLMYTCRGSHRDVTVTVWERA